MTLVQKMNGCVYYCTCEDMPYLIKIGRTVNIHERLRKANTHDTFKPPSGYMFGMVVRVDDPQAVEASLHAQFADKRLVNFHGNRTEFFAVSEGDVHNAFTNLVGERVDLSTLNPNAESEENAKTRLFLSNAIKNKEYCVYTFENPKTPGTKCHSRYDKYKHSRRLDEVLQFGTLEDIVYDYHAGFLTILPEPCFWL